MKIVWLCNYSPYHIKDKIKENVDYSNYHIASWLYYLKEEIESKYQDIELNIIFYWFFKKSYFVKDNNTKYYALNICNEKIFKIFNRKYLQIVTKIFYKIIESRIKKIVNDIKPDLINVHGSENIYGKIANNLNYPTLVTMQGIFQRVLEEEEPEEYKNNFNRRCKDEINVFKNQQYFQTVEGNMEDIIRKYNPDANFFRLFYPISNLAFELYSQNAEKNNDLIFVASLIKRKGVDDFIDLVSILVKKGFDIQAKIIGHTTKKQLEILNDKINKLSLGNNIKIIGYVGSHEEVLNEIKKSKVYVLPTYVDAAPRSVAEAMAIGTPVVSYSVDGLPAMIENKLSGLLVDKGNVEDLSESVSSILKDENLADYLKRNAWEFALNNFKSEKIAVRLIEYYKEVIKRENKK